MARSFSFFLFIVINSAIEAQELSINHVNALDFESMMKERPGVLVDVRTLWEFEGNHIPGALQINYYAFNFRRKILALPKDQPIYLYCRNGYRSRRAAEILAENGYNDIFNLESGINDWISGKLPISKKTNLTN